MTGKQRTRIYKNRWFAKFASREGISDATLVAAVDQANLSAVELKAYKQAAKIVLALTQAQIDTEVREERLFEVNDDAQDL